MSNLAEIRRAAIESDMEHRGFTLVGDQFHKDGAYGAMGHVRIDYWVKHGSVRIETSGGELPDAEARAEGMRQDLDTNVFDYWGDEINDLFLDWITNRPTSSSFSGHASAMQDGASQISPGPRNFDDQGEAADYDPGNLRLAGDLTNLETNVAHLQGNYAQEFSTRYVTYLGPVIERQCSLASVLAVVLGAERDIWQKADDDFTTFLERSATAMRESSPRGGGSGGAVVALTVVGAVAGVIGAIPTAGGSLAISAALVGGTASVAGGLLSSPPENPKTEIELGAGTPQGVRDKIKDGLMDMGRAIKREEEVLIDILDDVNATVGSPEGSRYFDLSEPAMNTAAPGDVLSATQVLVDEHVIGRICCLWLPTIAGDLRQARDAVRAETGDIWWRAAFIGYYYDGPRTEFETLQDHLVNVLTNTARELEDAAEALLAAAREIGLADDAVNAGFTEEAQRINDTDRNTPE